MGFGQGIIGTVGAVVSTLSPLAGLGKSESFGLLTYFVVIPCLEVALHISKQAQFVDAVYRDQVQLMDSAVRM